MLARAGMGIAFNAKPKVQQLAAFKLNQPSLKNILYFLGLTHHEIEQLKKL
jgi:phosphoserine phosphatase